MLSPRKTRLAFLPLLPIVLSVLVGLGIVAFRQTLSLGNAEAWLMAWMLAFVVGLPVSIVGLAVVGAMQRQLRSVSIIPLAGVKIPGAGQ